MANNSGIEWTDATWNPVTGCTKISAGCDNCYAERMALRLQRMGSKRYANGFKPTMHESVLREPFKWKKPKRIFVNSMSDLFHPMVTTDFIKSVFMIMNVLPRHTFQILTKRSARASGLSPILTMNEWRPNVWIGVTVENGQYIHRIKHLKRIQALRFISFEPLIGRIPVNDIDWTGIGWVIIGGESGPGARPMEPEWVHEIVAECQNHGIPVFFKQWGGTNKKKTGCLLNGKEMKQFPNVSL